MAKSGLKLDILETWEWPYGWIANLHRPQTSTTATKIYEKAPELCMKKKTGLGQLDTWLESHGVNIWQVRWSQTGEQMLVPPAFQVAGWAEGTTLAAGAPGSSLWEAAFSPQRPWPRRAQKQGESRGTQPQGPSPGEGSGADPLSALDHCRSPLSNEEQSSGKLTAQDAQERKRTRAGRAMATAQQ